MLSKKILQKLNEQVQKEYASSYLYLAMSTYCRSICFEGAANWFRVQSEEELKHAMKFIDYLEDQQGEITLQTIEQPAAKYGSFLSSFEKTLEHERFVTSSINAIMLTAVEEKDFATQNFLQWFVKEQVEEESSAQKIVDRIRMVGDSVSGLLYVDKELGKRAKAKE